MAKVEAYETRSGKRWRVRYRTPDRRQTDKRGFLRKRDAQAWAHQLEVDKRRGAYVAPAAGRVSLGNYAQEWLDSKHKLKPSTRARYQVVLDTFIADHAAVALGDINRDLIRGWVADLRRTHAPATVHKTIGVLRQVLDMAVADNRLVINPVDKKIELPAVDGNRAAVHHAGTAAHPGSTPLASTGPLVYVLGTCGLRFGEVAELRWRDVDVEKLRIRVARSVALVNGVFEPGTPKSGKGRTVSLPAFVADLLTRDEKVPDALVFPDSRAATCGARMSGGAGGPMPSRPPSLFPRT